MGGDCLACYIPGVLEEVAFLFRLEVFFSAYISELLHKINHLVEIFRQTGLVKNALHCIFVIVENDQDLK